jgi:FtsP/CotA-like multicopper oxidase with cupredoxin domain
MAAAIPIMMVAGAVISAVGAMSAAKAQSQAATYNATIADQNAQVSLSQATADAVTQQKQARQVEGSLIAGYGASGVTIEGSPTDVLQMSVTNAALDEANILYNGRLKATGFANEAELNRRAAKTAKEQGYYNAASSLLTGAGHAAYGYTAATKGYSAPAAIGPP